MCKAEPPLKRSYLQKHFTASKLEFYIISQTNSINVFTSISGKSGTENTLKQDPCETAPPLHSEVKQYG